jgi:5'-nucleotidase/UDP-sugar diphosphatase
MGHYENGEHGVNGPGDVTLARSLEPGAVNIIVGGHTHDAVCMQSENRMNTGFAPGDDCRPDIQNGVVIVQAGEWGKYVGRADFQVEKGEAKLTGYRLIPVNLAVRGTGEKESKLYPDPPIPQDSALESMLAHYQEQGGEELHRQVGVVLGRFEGSREVIRFRQTNLGRLIATAQQQRAQADCGVVNSGGIRDSFEKGAVTYKDILMVQPYGNTLTYTDMSGRELAVYLEKVASKPVDTGGYAQFSGVAMSLKDGRIRDLTIGGKPVDPGRTYRIAVPSYNAEGGDGYPRLVEHAGFVDTGFVDAEILMTYLETNSPLDPGDYAVGGR